jgi:hypothetical protein
MQNDNENDLQLQLVTASLGSMFSNPGERGRSIMRESDQETIDTLTCPEQFVLWATRGWVAAFKARQPIFLYLRQGFDMAGIPDGLFALDEIMGLLASNARRSLDFRCVKCRGLGADEALLLRCLAACQAGRAAEIDQVLAAWLPPAVARLAVRPAMVLATLLAGAGLRLPERPRTREFDVRATAYADPGLQRVQ